MKHALKQVSLQISDRADSIRAGLPGDPDAMALAANCNSASQIKFSYERTFSARPCRCV